MVVVAEPVFEGVVGEPVTATEESVVQGTIIGDVPPSEPEEVREANVAARRLMREHAIEFIARNGAEASYEAWIAQLHPENVKIDERLKTEGCEHQRIFQDALGQPVTATRSSSNPVDTSDGDAELARRYQAEEYARAAGTPFDLGLRSADAAFSLSKTALGLSGAMRDCCIAHAPPCHARAIRAATDLPLGLAAAGLRASESTMVSAVNMAGRRWCTWA